ncbi:MAG: glutamine-hydrolyzing GMP synthase, partial [Clostridiales bacterium]|jgi:GMP synthase (glutamine-hydrolysing)|nr:glutamine-hydrolyzing GMP synthase [Clostridiales bacterium]
MSELVLVLDFGGQYKELIARTVRGVSVYSEIRPGHLSADEIKRLNPIGIILTGGPNSVYLPDSPGCDHEIFSLGIPILGICYGMQLMCHMLGGEVSPGGMGEYGRVVVTPAAPSELLSGVDAPFSALMSHRDLVTRLPEGFSATASSAACPVAACENTAKKLYGVQFHPEVVHTKGGREILKFFLYNICGAAGDYELDDYIDTQIKRIRQKVGGEKVLLALSGGVDSSVCASLLSKAIRRQLICIFVDHGFMRLNEGDEIERVFSKRKLRFIRVNAQERFLARLSGVTDPETKRKRIGDEFIRVFEEEATKLGDIPFLAQGTIYPDIVESGGKYGTTIKSHHNVGGLPENLAFNEVIEPLSGLFKDEVRILGRKLGLPAFLVNRQPFPGPGLAIRVIGEVTKEKLAVLRGADAILREELDGGKRRPDQYFAVLTDTCSVGVKGDDRTYDPVIAIRAVTTSDFMTCEYAEIPHRVLRRISSQIISEIPSASRVVYDITSKPPATVEWE